MATTWFMLVALATFAAANTWPPVDLHMSEDEKAELLSDLKEWASQQPEKPTTDMARAFVQMKYMAKKQEQMNRLYTLLSNEIGRPSKGLWRKKKNSLPTLMAKDGASSQPSQRPNKLSSAAASNKDRAQTTISELLRPSAGIWKKNAGATDDIDQLMDIWKNGFRFKKSVA